MLYYLFYELEAEWDIIDVSCMAGDIDKVADFVEDGLMLVVKLVDYESNDLSCKPLYWQSIRIGIQVWNQAQYLK